MILHQILIFGRISILNLLSNLNTKSTFYDDSSNCDVKIDTGDRSFTLSEIKQKDDKTGKEKTTIELIDEPRSYDDGEACELCTENHSDEFLHQDGHTLCEGCRCSEAIAEYIESETKYHTTAFSTQLGFNWDFWMSIRELWSNCLDEGGEW